MPLSFYSPGGVASLGKHASSVRAVACADCGSVQLVASDLVALAGVYEEQRSSSLQLSDPRSMERFGS
jgi:hypothetical protein